MVFFFSVLGKGLGHPELPAPLGGMGTVFPLMVLARDRRRTEARGVRRPRPALGVRTTASSPEPPPVAWSLPILLDPRISSVFLPREPQSLQPLTSPKHQTCAFDTQANPGESEQLWLGPEHWAKGTVSCFESLGSLISCFFCSPSRWNAQL